MAVQCGAVTAAPPVPDNKRPAKTPRQAAMDCDNTLNVNVNHINTVNMGFVNAASRPALKFFQLSLATSPRPRR